MNNKEMGKLSEHFNKYFHQESETVMHPIVMEPHIDVLLYEPNEVYPFWKLVTMGASDYKMPPQNPSLGDHNEYMIFVDRTIDLKNQENAQWYFNKLVEIASFAYTEKTHITYGHSIEWGEEENEEMVAAYITMPQIIETPEILRCKTGLFKTVICLQAIALTRKETDKLLEIGGAAFDEYVYPEESDRHFLFERQRINKII